MRHPPNFEPFATPLGPGTRLGRYEILAPLARGGMAYVWAARLVGASGFSKIVALKTLLPELEGDDDLQQMLQDEAQIASQIQHPNCCSIVELGQEGELLYLAMEWVDGDSVARILKVRNKEPIDVRVAARIVSSVCAGLHAAHELRSDHGDPLGVVHRDVSPHNVLVSLDGHVKVTDFGVAKALGRRQRASQVGTIKGKLAYAAPEYVREGKVDRRSDVYSAGVVLFELTTGKRPFEGKDEFETLERTFAGSPTSPRSIQAGYPPDLEAIVLRAVSREPSQRFQTAEDMRVVLEAWLARSGPVVMETHVAAVLKERLGAAIAERNAAIHAAVRARSESQIPKRRSPPPSAFSDTGETEVVVRLVHKAGPSAPPRPLSQPPPLPARAQRGRGASSAPGLGGPPGLTHRELESPVIPRPAPLPDIAGAMHVPRHALAADRAAAHPDPSNDPRWIVIGDQLRLSDELTVGSAVAEMKPKRVLWLAALVMALVLGTAIYAVHRAQSPDTPSERE